MFHSAAWRLTVWYLAIIMGVSFLFSTALYRVSINELGRNADRQVGYFNNILGPGEFDNYTMLRQHQLNDDRARLKTNLIVFNLLVLCAGGAASYLLAKRTLKPIEDALDSQSRFAADASHELRTPLAAIQAENEVALRSKDLTKAQAIELLKSNLEEVAKLNTLSNGLLKLAAGNIQTNDFKKTHIKDVIDPVLERMSKTADQKKIILVNTTENMEVMGEAISLAELVTIFIDNAIKYSPVGGTVKIDTHKYHKYVVVKIIDQGDGIAAADLPNIFKRFYRSDSSRSKSTGGYGLGLALARKIADVHDGYIEVSSTVGSGSTFSIYIPGA